jgi:hypothetical protein
MAETHYHHYPCHLQRMHNLLLAVLYQVPYPRARVHPSTGRRDASQLQCQTMPPKVHVQFQQVRVVEIHQALANTRIQSKDMCDY